jgi:hypothetical protein
MLQRMAWQCTVKFTSFETTKGTTCAMHILSHALLQRQAIFQSLAFSSNGNSFSPSSLNRLVALLVPICLVCDPNATTLSDLS